MHQNWDVVDGSGAQLQQRLELVLDRLGAGISWQGHIAIPLAGFLLLDGPRRREAAFTRCCQRVAPLAQRAFRSLEQFLALLPSCDGPAFARRLPAPLRPGFANSRHYSRPSLAAPILFGL